MGGRNFEEEFGQALFFVSPTAHYVARETKIEPDRRLERFRVIKKKRELRDGVRVSDDLIWKDRQKKKQLSLVMKDAFEAGKRPRFHHCKLYIDGVLHQA